MNYLQEDGKDLAAESADDERVRRHPVALHVEFVERAFSSYYKLDESLQFLRGILYCYDFLDA